LAGSLSGKVALVTGGTRGIGAAISRRLAAEGASLMMTYLSRSHDADSLVSELLATGADAIAVQSDVAQPASIIEAVRYTVERFGRLDYLVNNAGLSIVGPLEDYPPEAFDRIFSVNVRAPFLAAQCAAKVMTDGGRIVTIGSIIADRTPGGGATLYAASKSALLGLTRGLARDLGPRRITVNLIQPGPIDTERNPADGPAAAELLSYMAIRRHGMASEVAGLVAYLLSEDASFITASSYNIDGGFGA
jgi:3-oxoacyl-[acyl-carrier protein] reductase